MEHDVDNSQDRDGRLRMLINKGAELAGGAPDPAVGAVIERARARWEDAPKHPAYERPAPPARRQNRRGQAPTQAGAAEGGADQQQHETLRLF